jgi:transcription antitermination factor NusG
MTTLSTYNTEGAPPFAPGGAEHGSAWFAVQTWPRYEKRVAAELEIKAVRVFLPVLSEKHKWSDRVRTVESPLFPGYLFVQIEETLNARVPVLRTNGVVHFVGGRGAGTPIPQTQIESVRILLGRKTPLQTHPFLSVGQRVRICSGSLQGVEGILTGRLNDEQRLVVSVQIIQRSVAIHLSGYQVEAA